VILAYLPEPDLARVIAAAHPSPVASASGERRPPLPESEFRAHLAAIRERGWILTKGEKLPGAVGTSAPVFGAAGIVGSLTVTIPEVRFQASMGPRIQRLVMESAGRISAVLGQPAG
jgi:IclR family acetate operon transcriptional repressor